MRGKRKLAGFFLIIMGLVLVFDAFLYNVQVNLPFGMALSLAGVVFWLNAD